MPYMMMISLEVSSAADAIGEFTTVFSKAWTFLTGNWYFLALIAVPLGAMLISTILGFIRSRT